MSWASSTTGVFRHCHTRTVGRLFFGLLQRALGNQGYGAQNTPLRLAAQHTA